MLHPAPNVIADDRTQHPAQGAADGRAGVVACEGGATDQTQGQQEYRGILHREFLSVGMTAAMLGLAPIADKHQPTIGRANSKYSKCLFFMGNFLQWRRS
ncbi:hypothetical protein G039_0324840 [Pseudomonas aeruginosa VRFPA01]|nr:hypothetical protein G039_0324840 [Pseudomonas aeruginosa VRFPA01]